MVLTEVLTLLLKLNKGRCLSAPVLMLKIGGEFRAPQSGGQCLLAIFYSQHGDGFN
jgi:hypothetical protein